MPDWRPISEFDPNKPEQQVHEQLNDRVIEWKPERRGKDWQEDDDSFYDDFPESGARRGTLSAFGRLGRLGSPIGSRLQSLPDGKGRMLTRDWKYWTVALIASGLLTVAVPFGIVPGIALLALCIHLLARRQRTINKAQ